MKFSSYQYYHYASVRRFLLQKHIELTPYHFLDITLVVSNTDLSSIEDMEILNSIRSISTLAGQNASLINVGSKYVGTSKKSFFSVRLNLKKGNIYPFFEQLSLCCLPNFQRRNGFVSVEKIKSADIFQFFTFCCPDLRLFTNYFPEICKSKLRIIFKPRKRLREKNLIVDFFRFCSFKLK